MDVQIGRIKGRIAKQNIRSIYVVAEGLVQTENAIKILKVYFKDLNVEYYKGITTMNHFEGLRYLDNSAMFILLDQWYLNRKIYQEVINIAHTSVPCYPLDHLDRRRLDLNFLDIISMGR